MEHAQATRYGLGMTDLRWYRMARTTTPLRLGIMGIVVATAVGWTHTSQSFASSTLTVGVPGPIPGTPPATGPVVVDIHAAVNADTPDGAPPQLSALGLRMPAGFSTTVAAIPPCDANTLKARRCPPASKLGTGKASALILEPAKAPTTTELSIFHGTGSSILVHASIGGRSYVVEGSILDWRPPDTPLLKLKLPKYLQPGVRAAVTRADITLTEGLVAGACQTGSWTFRSQLEFFDAVPAVTMPSVSCAPAPPAPAPPAPAPPVLHASARNSTRASGARFAISLSVPAKIKVTLERRTGKRWKVVRRVSVRKPAGSTSLTIHTAHGRRLPAGRYRSRLQAVDAAGAVSAPQIVRFTLR
jgi:hypothetical protein